MKKAVLAGMMSAIGLCALIAAPADASLTGEIAPRGQYGIIISNQDFVISNGSRVCFTTPNWSKVYLRNVPHPNRPPVTVGEIDGGMVERIAPAESSGMIDLEEYSVRCEGNRAEITLRASAPKELADVVVEHVALVLRAGLLEGAKYEITCADGTTSRGIIPMTQEDKSRRGLLPAFRKGIFHSDLGTLVIEVLEGPSLKLDDRRSAIFEGRGPAFIAWCDANPFDSRGRFDQKVAMTFDYPSGRSAEAVAVTGESRPDVVRTPVAAADFPLVPRPAKMEQTAEKFVPKDNSVLKVEGGSPLLLTHAKKIANAWGMKVVTSGNADCVLNVGKNTGSEAYTLKISGNGIQIQADSDRAGFYALQTLRGLYHNGAFHGVKISDRPAFRLRAVHAMADSDTLEHLAPFITDVLAPLKINALILECPYVKWETLQGMYHEKGMPKADLVKLLRIARENYIDVYPLIPTYSHCEWFFQNGKNLEMMDNPADNTAYNPLHPGVYPFLEKLFTEVLETFDYPEYFHISHDELTRQHPMNPEGRKLGVKTLFKNDILWHYEFFKKNNVKVMLWHDMLVSRAEAGARADANARGGTETLRKELPKDLTICVWNYNVPSANPFPEVKVVSQDRFPLVGAGWYPEGNLEALAKRCQEENALGMMVTTWHWKFDSAGLLYTQYGQMHSYVRAATLFWNPDAGVKEEAPEILVDLLVQPETQLGTLSFIPLTGNLLLAPEVPDFAELTGDEVRTADGVSYQLLRDNENQLAAISVNSRRLPHLPNKVRITLHQKFRRLHLLHTLLNRGMRKEGISVKLVFRYKDGSYEAVYPRNGVDVAYGQVPVFHNDGKTTFRPDEVGCLHDVPTFQRNQWNEVAWNVDAGKTCRIWSYTWENPHPEKELDHLLVEAQDMSTSYCLLSLTGENW